MIVIIDYGAGNLKSIKNALDILRIKNKISGKPKGIINADKLLLPGVGSFGYAMNNLERAQLTHPIKDAIKSGIPLLGVCLGIQLLFEKSEESPGVRGLSVLKGKVIKFRHGKTPQVGWNKVILVNPDKSFFNEGYGYFLNSYHVIPKDQRIISTKTDYYTEFCSSIETKNILATQFHPEKSGEFGLDMIRRWAEQ